MCVPALLKYFMIWHYKRFARVWTNVTHIELYMVPIRMGDKFFFRIKKKLEYFRDWSDFKRMYLFKILFPVAI